MNTKERVARVKQIIGSAGVTRGEGSGDRRAAQIKRVTDELKRKFEAEKKLRETGIVDLLEAIRDEGVVKFSNKPYCEGVEIRDYRPALVDLSGNQVSMVFNHELSRAFSPRQGVSYDDDYICAYLETSGRLVVRGREKMVVGEDPSSMADAVGMAILRPRRREVER